MNNTIYCSSVTMTSTNVVLVPNREVKNLTNRGSYKLIICSNAIATSNLPVLIQTAIGDIPVLCKAGNTIYASQLQKRYCYCIMYGNENENYPEGQIVIQNKVNAKPTIETTTVASKKKGE